MATKMNYIFTADATPFARAAKSVKDSTTNLGVAIAKTKGSYASWFKDNKKMGQSFNNLSKDINRSSQSFSMFSKGLNFAKGIAGAYALGRALETCITASISAIETQNLFNVAMGETVEKGNEFAEALSKAYGLDISNIKNAVGTFSLLAKSMGMSSDQAYTLSTQIYQVGLDLASLINVSPAQAMGDLKSGLLGQTETMYKYGVDLTEAGLKTEAALEGITKSVRNMNQGEKMALRYNSIIRKTALYQGDFAKTINEPANQLKMLSERFVTLTRSIGNIFIPILRLVLPLLNGLIIVLIEVADAVATFFGYDKNKDTPLTGAASTAEELGNELDGDTASAKKLQKTLLGIDEINKMSSPTEGTSGGSSSSILTDIKFLSPYDVIKDLPSKAKEIAESIKNFFNDSFSKINLTNLITAFDNLKASLKPFSENVGSGLKWLWDNVLVPIGTWIANEALPAFLDAVSGSIKFMDGILEGAKPSLQWLWENFLKPLGEWVGKEAVEDLKSIGTHLGTIGEWASENSETIGLIATVVGAFLGTIKLVNVALGIFSTVSAIAAVSGGIFAGVLAAIGGPITLIIAAIVACIAFIVYLVANWDWAVAQAKYSINKMIADWTGLFNNIGAFFKNLWEDITKAFVGAWESMDKTCVKILSGMMNWIYDALDDIKGFFDGLYVSIIEGLANAFNSVSSGFKSFVNIIIGGLNTLIRGVNKIKIDIPDWVPNYGGQSFGINIREIPYLAKGAIVESPTMAMIGEAGSEAVIPLNSGKIEQYFAPVLDNIIDRSGNNYETTFKAMKDALKESESNGNNVFNVYIDDVYQNTVEIQKRKNTKAGKVIIPIGG